MAGELIREVKLRAKFDMTSLNEADKEIQKFFDKYENKKATNISLFDLRTTIENLSTFKKTLEKIKFESPELMANKGFTHLLSNLENYIKQFDSIVARFDNNSIKKGFQDISSAIDFEKLAIMAGGFSERLEYLREQAKLLVDAMKEVGNIPKFASNWEHGSFDKTQLQERIELLRQLIETQQGLDQFYGGKLGATSFESQFSTDGLKNIMSRWKLDLEEMKQYNIQTTELLQERRRIINEVDIYGDLNWSSEQQQLAKSRAANEQQYNADLQSLQNYILNKEELLRRLKESEYTLFSGDYYFEDYVKKVGEDLASYQSYLKDLQNFKSKGNTQDFSEVVKALEEIKRVINEIKVAFEPLTNALNKEGTAFSKMAQEGSASLDTLLEKLKQLESLMDIVSKKDFTSSITQVFNTKQTTAMSNTAQFDLYKQKAQMLLDVVQQLKDAQADFSKTNQAVYSKAAFGQGNSEFIAYLNKLEKFDPAKLGGKIAGAETLSEIKKVVGELDVYKNTVLDFVNVINKIAPNSINTSFLSALNQIDEKINEAKSFGTKQAGGASSAATKQQDTNINTDATVDQIKKLSGQIEPELKTLRQQIEAVFDLSTIDFKRDTLTEILNSIYQQFVDLQTKIKTLDFSIQPVSTNTATGNNVSQSGVNTSSNVDKATDSISQEGQAAALAAQQKLKFVEANNAAAQSADKTNESAKNAASGIKEEGNQAEAAAQNIQKSSEKIRASQDEITRKYRETMNTTGKVNDNIAQNFNAILEQSGINVEKILMSFQEKTETVGKGKDKQVISYDTIKLIAQYTDEAGKASSVTREFEVATGALIKRAASFKEVKDSFDLSTAKTTAASQVAELEKRMGSFKIDIADVKEALKNITDESSLKAFEIALDAANQKIKEIKASLKSSKSLDPIVNSENMMANLETTVATYRENIKKLSDIEGFKSLETSLNTITTKIKEFQEAQKSGDGKKMAAIVAEINSEIAKYNANLKLVNARYQENTRAATESAKAEKQRASEASAAARASAKQSKLELDVNRQFSLLSKQQAQWAKNGQLTDEVNQKINEMLNSLVKVTNSSELSAWKTQWAIVKDEVVQTRYEIEAANKAQKEANAAKASERSTSKAHWDSAFKESLNNLIAPEKRPELEQLKAYMLQQAENTKNEVVNYYDMIMTIIQNKNNAMKQLMSAKGPNEKQYWQEQYSAWLGMWNQLDQNAVGNFFKDAAVQATLGAEKIDKFNKELETSTLLSKKQSDNIIRGQQKKQEELNKELERINKQNQNYGKATFSRETRAYEDIQTKKRAIDESAGLTADFQKKIDEYEAAYRRLENLRKIFAEDPKASSDIKLTKQFQDAALKAENLRKRIQDIYKEVDNINKIPEDNILGTKQWDVSKFNQAKDAMKAFANEVSNGTFKFEKFNENGTKMQGTFVNSKGEVEKLAVSLNRATGEMTAFGAGADGAATSIQKIKTSAANALQSLGRMYFSLYSVIRYLRQGYKHVKDIDDAMTELKKVTDETVASYKEFQETAGKISKEIGTTMSAFISSAADWARLGYDLREATELAKNTSVLMNVSEFDDISKATDTMISALQAFKQEGTDVIDLSQQILDAYNEVGNNYAISTSDLADSLTRSSAALVAAGNSLSEAIALTTAANTTIQNPETVGTALKTLSMRLRGTSVEEITKAGEETDGLISSTSKLAAKIQELTSIDGDGGVKILTESGDFKSTYQILLEIAQVWHDIDNMDQAALLEIVAGKRAGSVVASILSDAELLKDVFDSAENSANSAMDELQVHLDSIEGRIQTLTTSIQTMWNNFLNSEVIKFVVSLLTKFVDIVNAAGLLPTVLGGVLAVQQWKASSAKTKDKATSTGIINAITTGFDKVAAAQKAKAGATSTSSKKAPSATTNAAVTGASTKVSDATIGTITKQKEATDGLTKSKEKLNSTVVKGDKVEKVSNGTKQKNVKVVRSTVVAQQQENATTNIGIVAKLKHAAATTLQTAKTFALKVAMAGLQMAAMMLVGVIINSIITAFTNWAQKMDDLKTEAINASDALDENRKSIKGYRNEIEELRATLESNTASEKDAYDARARLMEIQDDLIAKYGHEAKGINLVTGAIQDQIDKINKLDVESAKDYVTEYYKAFNDAKMNVEKEVKSTLSLSNIQDNDFKKIYFEKLSELGFMDTSYIQGSDVDLFSAGSFTISGTREEIADRYDELVDWLRDYAETHPIDVDSYINQISISKSGLKLNDEDYKKDLEVYNNFLANKAISDYTDVYGNILDAQGKYQEALIDGDIKAQEEHKEALSNYFEEADKASKNDESMNKYFANMRAEYEKEWAQTDFSVDIKDKNKKILNIDGEDVEVDVKSIAKSVKKEFDAEGLVADDIINIGKLLTAEEGGQEVDWGNYSTDQIETYKKLAAAAESYGVEVEDLIEVLNRLGYIKYSPNAVELTNVGKTVDMLSSSMEKYQSAMEVSKELTYDNMQMSQEYYTALTDYLGDSAELREAIYTENGEYIVTNIELLEDLIKKKQKEQAADVKLSRAQARLRYYELYKQMRNLTKGQNKLTGSALDEVDALYEQMGSIEKTIAKYSLLETKLLGVTNAYTDLELAQAADEETDYGSKAETMVNALAEAFNTAELGTEAAQVAIAGLIPDDVIDKTKTLDEQMKQIHTYFTKGELSKLFKIEYNDDGEIESVEMTKEKIEGFVKTLTKTDLGDGLGTVFQGTWDEFTLNPAITSLEQFAEACGLTEEVAFSFLTELERYDIGWLGEDFSTLLDQLMGDDIDYQLYDKMQKLADLEYKIAHGTITKDEQKQYGTLIGEMEVLEEQALDTVSRYGELSGKLDETKQDMINLNEELANTKEGTDEYEALQGEIDKAQQEAAGLVNELEKLGGEPTEFTLEVALDEANEQIDKFKKDLNSQIRSGDKNAVKINAVINEIDANGLEDLGLTKDASGRWQGLANIKGYSSLDPESQQEVLRYLELINSTHIIDAMMGDGITTIEEHLDNIVTILEKTYELSVQAQVDDSEVDKFVDWLNKTVFSKAITFTTKLGDAWNDVVLGGGFGTVNGTAHASGTAHAHGNWGAPRTETALVGELGTEMRVRGSRWELIGQNGAEFTDVRKGDIIFNHKQTEDLLSHGYITGRGKAYAYGTSGAAYAYERGSGTIGVSYTDEYYKARQKAKVLEKRLEEIDIKASKSSIAYEASQLNKKIQAAQTAAQAQIDTWDKAYKNASSGIKTYDSGAKNTGSGSDKDDSEQLIDFIEIKLEEIEAIISKTTAKLENYVDDTSTLDEKNDAYDKLVEAEKNKASTYFEAAEYYNKKATELLEKVPKEYREKAKNGAIEIKNFVGEEQTEIAEAIQEYRDMANKADEAEVGYLEAIAQQAAYRVEQLEDIASDFENIVNYIGHESSLIQANMDLVSESGERLSAKYYQELIKNSKEQQKQLQNERRSLQKILDDSVKAGDVKVGDDDWYQMVDAIASVDEEIVQCSIDMEEFQNAINDLKWEALDKLIAEFDHLDSQLSHLHERLTDGKVVDDEGNWTDEGIAAMGVLAQQMEVAEEKSKQYANAINSLKKDYKKGLYSTDEYNEKLAELTENQWDSIEAYEDAKDAIVDLNKTRIDAVKDGMEKEIDAYKELIEKKKEALDADKDLYDFEKSIAEKEKSIDDIDRRLAALSGDTSISAMAERKQLEAERAEIQAEMDDAYYERSIENQKTALDNESSNYEEYMNSEMEKLDRWLTNEELVISESMQTVKANTTIVLSEIDAISQQYGIQISGAITKPWKDGEKAIASFDDNFKTTVSSFTAQLDLIIAKQKELEQQAIKTANALLGQISGSTSSSSGGSGGGGGGWREGGSSYSFNGAPSDSSSGYYDESGNELTKGEAENILGTVGGVVYDGDGNAHDVNTASTEEQKKKKGYAKGTLGVKKSDWAWIDEIGEELVLHADSDGKLSYLTKGTSVVPSDITSKLLDLVADPTQTLEASRPVISAPKIVNNEINVDMSFGSVVNIEHVDQNDIPNLTKTIEKQMDKYMKNLNNQIRKYAR